MERNEYSGIIEDWRKRCVGGGRQIEIDSPSVCERGHYIDINDNGALCYRSEKGIDKELVSGSMKYI